MMKKFIRRNWIWLLAMALILCVIPAAYILAKTVEAQEAGDDILLCHGQ